MAGHRKHGHVGRTALVAWGEEWSSPLELAEVDYRVRYSGAGMDEANDQTRMDGDAELDRYLLQFWPAPAQPDRVVKQTSALAAYWHASIKERPDSTGSRRKRGPTPSRAAKRVLAGLIRPGRSPLDAGAGERPDVNSDAVAREAEEETGW